MNREAPRIVTAAALGMTDRPTKPLCKNCDSPYHYQTFCPQKKREPIAQRGKEAKRWETFRDKVAIPYLDNKYGHVCSVEGCDVTKALDVDHIASRGARHDLKYDVKNLRYLCRKHHIERTGVPEWTAKT